ncbi:hypothetical protein Q1695_007597 [Nippostrongylus brasiliensis]|nr:hypothetical protein Q1695_007597 [Nippostrongylus brasiliensis]
MCKIVLLILAVFTPPLAVLFDRGCRRAFWLNCLLTLCFFIPGVVHAFIVILSPKHHDHHDHHHHDHYDDVVVTRNVQYVQQPVILEHGHHHHHREVIVTQVGQPVIVQPAHLGDGVVTYQSQPVYPVVK